MAAEPPQPPPAGPAAAGGSPMDKLKSKPAEIVGWWKGMTAVFGSEVLILLASVSRGARPAMSRAARRRRPSHER